MYWSSNRSPLRGCNWYCWNTCRYTGRVDYEAEKPLKVAVLERDIPCAKLALEDLQELLQHLQALDTHPSAISALELTVFTNEWLGDTAN